MSHTKLIENLAPHLDDIFNPNKHREGRRRVGFLICAFDFGTKGTMAYATNAQLEDLPAALDELRAKFPSATRVITPEKIR